MVSEKYERGTHETSDTLLTEMHFTNLLYQVLFIGNQQQPPTLVPPNELAHIDRIIMQHPVHSLTSHQRPFLHDKRVERREETYFQSLRRKVSGRVPDPSPPVPPHPPLVFFFGGGGAAPADKELGGKISSPLTSDEGPGTPPI